MSIVVELDRRRQYLAPGAPLLITRAEERALWQALKAFSPFYPASSEIREVRQFAGHDLVIVSETARCDSCGREVPSGFSVHNCTEQPPRMEIAPLPDVRSREFFSASGCLPVPSKNPESIRYVPDWAEKL